MLLLLLRAVAAVAPQPIRAALGFRRAGTGLTVGRAASARFSLHRAARTGLTVARAAPARLSLHRAARATIRIEGSP